MLVIVPILLYLQWICNSIKTRSIVFTIAIALLILQVLLIFSCLFWLRVFRSVFSNTERFFYIWRKQY